MDFTDIFLKALGKAAPWTLRRFYSVSKCVSLIDINVPSQGDGFSYQYFTQQAGCWFQITNRSPFDITVDRVDVDAKLSGYGAQLLQLIPIRIEAGAKQSLYVKGILLAPPVEKIREIEKRPQVMLNLRVYVRCRVREFVHASYINDLRNITICSPQ